MGIIKAPSGEKIAVRDIGSIALADFLSIDVVKDSRMLPLSMAGAGPGASAGVPERAGEGGLPSGGGGGSHLAVLRGTVAPYPGAARRLFGTTAGPAHRSGEDAGAECALA